MSDEPFIMLARRLERAAVNETAALPVLELQAAQPGSPLGDISARALPEVRAQAEALALAARIAGVLARRPDLALAVGSELLIREIGP